MPTSFSGLGNLLPSRLFRVDDGGILFITAHLRKKATNSPKKEGESYFRQLEQEMETVIKVLQPGPLGIIEHKFSAEEIQDANATVHRAVANWRRNANLGQKNPIFKDYIHK